ncbi:VOC family protein [Isobaculum melis]|uniref:Lactoylglutathione lyase n=1 Tax=Isobaculum melis TaxID=142588 RepID=A0A1H9S3Z3_9LACT|nr:VOC family protein [Isobaculum melis]SER79658.1 lactoylglutathione lyase [Isobaculum melis]
MIQKIAQVMLYVNDPQKVADFWIESLDFVTIYKENTQGIIQIVIAPSRDSETQFVLFERAVIEKLKPELNFGTPSILLASQELDALYQKLQKAGVTVGKVVHRPQGRVFNFADPEGHYFAVMEEPFLLDLIDRHKKP